MSELGDAFQELRVELDSVIDTPQTVEIAGEEYPAIIEEVPFEPTEENGGEGDTGTFRVMVAQEDCPDRPADLSIIIARGQTLQIVSVTDVNGVTWNIEAADIASEE